MATRTRLANDAWEALLSAHARLMKEFAAEDLWQDLSMREYDVLYTLSKRRQPVRMSELHRQVLLSQPALSRMVDRLVERGLIARRPDPADGRGVRLSATDAGRDIQQQIGRRHARSVTRALTTELRPDELRQLAAIGWKLAGRPAAAATSTRTSHDKELVRT
jgi:DNA-binding MarR family transcriptional regulator